jgi:hypothetical protein
MTFVHFRFVDRVLALHFGGSATRDEVRYNLCIYSYLIRFLGLLMSRHQTQYIYRRERGPAMNLTFVCGQTNHSLGFLVFYEAALFG